MLLPCIASARSSVLPSGPSPSLAALPWACAELFPSLSADGRLCLPLASQERSQGR